MFNRSCDRSARNSPYRIKRLVSLKVLCTAPILRFPKVVEKFNSSFDGDIEEYLSYEKLLDNISAYDGIIPNARIPVNVDIIDNASSLKALYQPSMGYNHIDVDLLNERSIKFGALSLDDEFRTALWSTAEHTLSLILTLLKQSISCITSVKNTGAWDNRVFSIRDLRSRTVGVVGYGNIGQKVAHLCRAFGANVVAHDPYIEKSQFEDGVEFLSLDEVFSRCDIVTLHVPLNDETKNLVTLEHLAKMSSDALIINAARGGVVNEDDLMTVLKDKKIGGAALDVLENESPTGVAHIKLIEFSKDYNNLIVTPHVGGSSLEYMEAIFLHSIDRLKEMLSAQ